MNRGFFNDDGNYDFLENMKVKGGIVNVFQFLHGNCHTFAIVLAEMLNCSIGLWTEYDEDMCCEVLIHAFAVESKGGVINYVDIRGKTDDFKDITDEFDYMYEPVFNTFSREEAESKLKSMGIVMSDVITAKKFLNYYSINYKN